MRQLDGEHRMREDAKEYEEARLRISSDVMEGKAGALEEDERLRGRIVEGTRGLMSTKKEQGGGDAAWTKSNPGCPSPFLGSNDA